MFEKLYQYLPELDTHDDLIHNLICCLYDYLL